MSDRDHRDAEDEATPQDKKSNVKLFIIIGIVAVLIGGGVAGYFAMTSKAAPEEAKKGHAKEEKKGEKKEEKKEGEGKKGGGAATTEQNPNMYHVEPFIVNIFDGADMRYLKLTCVLETETPETQEVLKLQHSKIRDAILNLATAKSLREIYDQEGKVKFRKDIVDEVNKVIAPEKVNQVYFTDFIIQ